ncbi:hypothetical protein F5Y10DRAFT_252237 [Nemania abortiva]|nr:hypothetical protein F5Y10DRAFT_252237 [Nemania abortiva]
MSAAKETSQQHSALDGGVSDGMISDSDYSSESGSEDNIDRGSGRPKVSKMTIIVSHIFEHVQLLYHFGSLLRRPGLKGRYLRHKDSDDRNIATFFDTRHIEEKLRHWDRQAGEGINISPEEESVTEQVISERREGESPKSLHYILSQRFANANAQRREQLKYWVNNPYRPDHPNKPQTKDIIGKRLPGIPEIQEKSRKDDSMTEDDSSTIKPESKGPKSDKSKSTALSFSTVAESAILESETETGKPRTIYAESVVAGKWSARVPPPPKRTVVIDGIEQFECPYCYMILDARLTQDRTAWKRHVFRDLRPYSCTFADCTNPNKLYTTRHEWKYHEMQLHRRSWVCHECNRTFEEKTVLSQHLYHSHPGNWTDHQLPVILEMSERPMDDSIILPCSLCKSELSLVKLLDHLAAHMEEISLFVLPNHSDPEDDISSNDAIGTYTHKDSDNSELSQQSSLQFSDIALSDREALEGEASIPSTQEPVMNPGGRGLSPITEEPLNQRRNLAELADSSIRYGGVGIPGGRSPIPTIPNIPKIPTQLKVKVTCDTGDYVMLVVSFNATYLSLINRIDGKLARFTDRSISKDGLKLKYRDEDGDLVTVECDDDVQIVFLDWCERASINIPTDGVGEIELLCIGNIS